ncbi:hypothetical protein SBRCBS47491_001081 [Sporothrix bragantina]|uniref:Endonuclease/exonuclease/phosphatase family protein n=1 Tax=Sporothrix bragantina TaxID=671064 RepID=A0ABP0AVZ9_9PEZI
MYNLLLATLALGTAVSAQSINAINGNRFMSPYNGKSVSGVVGVVTAKTSTGLYLRSPKLSCDSRVGNGLYVYSSTLGKNASIAVGDTLTLGGTIADYRSTTTYLYSTELTSPVVQDWTSGHGVAPQPRVLGSTPTLCPPTEQFTSLDNGDIFGVPNNSSQISVVNPSLQPDQYGLDFWKSLNGDLVTMPAPVAIGKPNSYGETWMVGSWPATGRNARGGLTLSSKDANPESIIVGSPLDGSDVPTTYRIGDSFEDITGVVHYQYGFYYLLPLTAPVYKSSASPALPPATTLLSTGECSGLTIGDYNVENFAPSDTAHVSAVAAHIVDYMKTPDVLFVQEIQDNDGPTNDGVVDSSTTLNTLVSAISARTGGIKYSYTVINPVNNADGGQTGGNIRVAYLYNAAVVRLADSTSGTAGGALDANVVSSNSDGMPVLKYNPGRIDPTNACWASSRKPLVAAWQTVVGDHVFFTVNVHWESKGGSSSLQGDLRPPVNLPVVKRTTQGQVTGQFVADILALDSDARVVVAGDFNEYSVVAPVETFASVSGMIDLDVAANISVEERYTYTYDNNMEELDHLYVSSGIAGLSPSEEHLHVNSWVSYDDQTSDHDPTVAQINVCGNNIASGSGLNPSSVASTSPKPSSTSSSASSAAATTLSTVTKSSATSAASSSAPSSAPSGAASALSGKGHLEVSSPGVASGGALITAGTWYRGGGTPASYTATPSADGIHFTLSTSKGSCAILDTTMALSCASTVTTPSSFGYDGTYLTYNSGNTFYATAVPSGTTQGTVYAVDQSGVTLQISWVAV